MSDASTFWVAYPKWALKRWHSSPLNRILSVSMSQETALIAASMRRVDPRLYCTGCARLKRSPSIIAVIAMLKYITSMLLGDFGCV